MIAVLTHPLNDDGCNVDFGGVTAVNKPWVNS